MKLKRVISLLLVFSLVLMISGYGNPVMAAKLPSAIWALFDEETALDSGGSASELIEVRLEIIGLFDDWSDTEQQKLDIVTPRYRKIAESYETLLQYDNAVAMLEKYIYYAGLQETYGTWNHDAVTWAESKLKSLNVSIDLFVETDMLDNAFYTGAKFEPVSGTYFGATYDRDDRVTAVNGYNTYEWSAVSQFFPKKNSAYLIYLEFGTDISSFSRYFEQAVAAGNGIEVAWNNNQTYSSMSQNSAYIRSTISYLDSLGVPIFLRYGAEMNIAEGFENSAQYVENFRYIANIVHNDTENIAMVWSVNDVTASDRTLDEYYPGDTYVDWVGISTYTYYYFGDKTDWGTQQDSIDTIYFTGSKANPLSKVKEVVDFVDGRKPIMISESGISHYSKIANEDMTDWAVIQLKRQYEYMSLVYPEIKAIFYFNVDADITSRHSYALYTNETMADTYNDLVADAQYLSDVGDSNATRYALVGSRTDKSVLVTGSTINMKTYAIIPDETEASISYKLDGSLLTTTKALPYAYTYNVKNISTGTHTMEVQLKKIDGTLIKTAIYTLIKDSEGVRIEEGTFASISFSDTSKHWSNTYVLEIAKRGIIVGSGGLYRPEDYISRAEMTSIISKLGDLPTDAAVSYSDVSSSAWYYKYVSGAQKYLTASGSLYEPTRNATREEIITALMKLKGYNTSSVTDSMRAQFKAAFNDAGDIKSEFLDYMILAVEYGIVGGYEDKTLRPANPMKRSEVAKVLQGVFY